MSKLQSGLGSWSCVCHTVMSYWNTATIVNVVSNVCLFCDMDRLNYLLSAARFCGLSKHDLNDFRNTKVLKLSDIPLVVYLHCWIPLFLL